MRAGKAEQTTHAMARSAKFMTTQAKRPASRHATPESVTALKLARPKEERRGKEGERGKLGK